MKTRSMIAYGSAAPWTGSARTWTVRFGLGHANNVHVPDHSAPAHDGAQPGIVMIGRVRGSWSTGWRDPVPPAGTGTALVPNVVRVVEDALRCPEPDEHAVTMRHAVATSAAGMLRRNTT